MSSLSIFDDGRSPTPGVFNDDKAFPFVHYANEVNDQAYKHFVDHHLDNFRQSLWSLERTGILLADSFSLENGYYGKEDAGYPHYSSWCGNCASCSVSASPTANISLIESTGNVDTGERMSNTTIPVGQKDGSGSAGVFNPALGRHYLHRCSDGSYERIPPRRKTKLEEAPPTEQIYGGCKVWNMNPTQKLENDMEAPSSPNSVQDSLQADFSTASPPVSHASVWLTAQVPSLRTPGKPEEHVLTPPATPTIAAQVWDNSISYYETISENENISDNENISEELRRCVARKQYYDRSGILWDCAAKMLEKVCLHPTNLTEYEFTKLVCIQGYEVFEWILSNAKHLVNRAERQWYRANTLLRNNAGLDGLNMNFMDDFLWMDSEYQVSFIRSYRRLQLEAVALREGVELSEKELDSVSMTQHDDDKLAIIHRYKESAYETSMKKLALLNDSNNRPLISAPEADNVKVDNLHIKFLQFGLGQEKRETFRNLVGISRKLALVKNTEPVFFSLGQEHGGLREDLTSKRVVTEPRSLPPIANDLIVTLDVERLRSKDSCHLDASGQSESSNGSLGKSDSSFWNFDGPSHRASVSTTAIGNLEMETPTHGVEALLPLRFHRISYSDLRGLTSSTHMDTIVRDDGSDWDFSSPSPRSLRKKRSRILDVLKKPFTFKLSSRSRSRGPVKGVF